MQKTIASHVREIAAFSRDVGFLMKNSSNRKKPKRICSIRLFSDARTERTERKGFESNNEQPNLRRLDRWFSFHSVRLKVRRKILFFIQTFNYPLFYKGESYVMTIDGLQYSRYFMNQIIGKKTTDSLHEFAEALHALNITHVEHSLLIPIILSLPDPRISDPQSLHIVKYCYMYAFYIQLCTTRAEDEAKFTFDRIIKVRRSFSFRSSKKNLSFSNLLVGLGNFNVERTLSGKYRSIDVEQNGDSTLRNQFLFW